ncbi:hypothetical protein E2C01_026848 [Portunus trituberculatus]|uniref:Uncharacterized protein n=1 Tax=Portunus trituberculatus TaxID=210409 RepID=A0A5B7EJX1_PORTR|nr:hypothetical protein [Portunus trituberculatus]
MRKPVPMGLMQKVNINTDTVRVPGGLRSGDITTLIRDLAAPTLVNTPKVFVSTWQVQFSSEDLNPCSFGASQNYPHSFILKKLQGTELGGTKLY